MSTISKSDRVRVRLAPSPTGNLHVGTTQSALYNWLFARKNEGQFYLRIEDTDKERSKNEFIGDITTGLEWLDLNWDGEIVYQSERISIYKKHLEKLLVSGKAFWCNHSKEELEEERRKQMTNKEAPRHICAHKKEHLDSGQVIRLDVDTGSGRDISFEDEIRGLVSFKESLLGDFSIAKSTAEPLYNFAVVVDDMEVQISHVIRGEDHISNTPKQILIYESLDAGIPKFAHLPLLLGPDRSKLSKRHGATSLNEYKKDYLSEALANFLAILSHTYSKEILTREEMVSEFDLKKVHKSGAVFDIKKLNWLNSQYVKNLSPEDLRKNTGISEISDAAVPLVTERLEKLSEAGEYSYLWQEPEYDTALLQWKGFDLKRSRESLEAALKIFKNIEMDKGEIKKNLDELGVKLGDRGLAYWPLRTALSGKEKSPDPVELAVVLGKEEVLKRIETAVSKLSK